MQCINVIYNYSIHMVLIKEITQYDQAVTYPQMLSYFSNNRNEPSFNSRRSLILPLYKSHNLPYQYHQKYVNCRSQAARNQQKMVPLLSHSMINSRLVFFRTCFERTTPSMTCLRIQKMPHSFPSPIPKVMTEFYHGLLHLFTELLHHIGAQKRNKP
jgi:hypothetical protein